MTPDRADDLARRLVRVLLDGDGNPGIDIAGTWFDCATDEPADVQAIADDVVGKLATALRAYAEEAKQQELEACGRTLFGVAEIAHGTLTDQAFFARNLATT